MVVSALVDADEFEGFCRSAHDAVKKAVHFFVVTFSDRRQHHRSDHGPASLKSRGARIGLVPHRARGLLNDGVEV